MNRRTLLASMLGAIALTASAEVPTYSIDGHIISAGASSRASNACFALEAVIAEPVAGFSAGGQYDLSAGFSSVVAPLSNDHIFANGFEDCTP
jgi:hypothetical protein